MKSMRIALVTIVAVFAFSAVAASSAFASPEWYAKKAGVFAKVSKATKMNFESKFELSDTKYSAGIPLAVACTGEGSGEINVGGKGAISLFKVTRCEPAKVELNWCQKFETASMQNAPWGLELYKEGSEIRERIVSGGSGTPAWRFTCDTVSGIVADECNATTSTLMTNNVSGGLVEAAFEKKSAKTQCSQGGKEAGEWKGVLKLKANETGVEAIKVE
jgi:hypothetical protein